MFLTYHMQNRIAFTVKYENRVAYYTAYSLHTTCPNSLPPIAMSSSTPSKRSRTQDATPEEEYGHLEKWFTGEQTQMVTYLHEVSQKSIIVPKYIRTDWLKEEQLDEVRRMINYHKLKKFLGLTSCIYPNLVKVFYTNLHVEWARC